MKVAAVSRCTSILPGLRFGFPQTVAHNVMETAAGDNGVCDFDVQFGRGLWKHVEREKRRLQEEKVFPLPPSRGLHILLLPMLPPDHHPSGETALAT
jgi:hypothetical protein